MCIGQTKAPLLPPAPPIPRLPNNLEGIANTAQTNQKRKAQARASGTGRRRNTTLLGRDEPITREPLLTGV